MVDAFLDEHACMNYLHTVDEIWPLKAELPKEELVAAGPQAAPCEHCVATARHLEELTAAVHALPKAVDAEIAALKLRAMGINYDVLSGAQVKYLGSWEEGT